MRPGYSWYVTPSRLTMIIVEAPGTVTLGSPASEPGHDASNEQTHTFDIGWSFAISATEITQAQFLALCPESTHSINETAPEPDCPANSVKWLDAVRYCRLLSEADGIAQEEMVIPEVDSLTRSPYADLRTHLGYRLPIEAEWETACRAGTITPRYFGYCPDLLVTHCGFASNSAGRLMPVGSLLPNQWAHSTCWAMPLNGASIQN